MLNFKALVAREWQLIAKDKWLQAALLWLPGLLFLFVAWIFSAGIATGLPVGVVDHDDSTLSNKLIRYYDAAPAISAATRYSSEKAAFDDLRNGSIYAVIVLPENLLSDTFKGYSPQVSAFYNSQYILVGKLVHSALLGAHSTFNAAVEVKNLMAHGRPVTLQAAGIAVPVRMQMTPLFNLNLNYAQFLVSAIVPAMWQIFIVATAVMSLVATDNRVGLKQALSQNGSRLLLAKLSVLFLLHALTGAAFLAAMFGQGGWAMNGSWVTLIVAQWLMILACCGIGFLFYLVFKDATRALSFVAGFTAPAFAFMGVTFPASDMLWLAKSWRALLPVSHYVGIQISETAYGASVSNISNSLLSLLALCIPLLVCFYICQKQCGKVSEAMSV
ncbi:ABC transporter permease [Parasalinivibrio latis]|uniref:ABC transporter permease n=1 Tax=Parasalinivibrio latis TaxID=2952610 RepID=UPI0030E3B3C3